MAPGDSKTGPESTSPEVVEFGCTKLKAKEVKPEEKGGKRTDLPNVTPNATKGPTYFWSDKLLKKLVQNEKVRKVAWLPGSDRHIDEGRDAYEPFTHIVRTLHLEDALQVLATNRMKPKEITSFSSLQPGELPNDHPCKKLKVLWFSARLESQNEQDPNWYGNVEFVVPCPLLLEMFKYSFLVEIITKPTHTDSRVLLTNTDYSSVLPLYKRKQTGRGWKVNKQGLHFGLRKCSRYRFQGWNVFDHVMEFMLEVTADDEKKILSNCKIDFKNHEEAKDDTQAHVCHRYVRQKKSCPTPYTPVETAAAFRSTLEGRKINLKKIYPKLTGHAKQCLQEAEENTNDFSDHYQS